jgi:glycosyltransferase involved in cell wall biosynthesis
MRILEIGKYWPPQRGGMETLLQQYCEGLTRRGHRIRALVSASGPDDERSSQDGVELWRCARYGELASVPVCPSLPGALRRSLVELDPEVVHLHLPNPLAAASWLLVGDSRPLVVSYHSDIVRQRALLRLWSPWRGRILDRATCILTTSDALIESSPVLTRFADRCHSISPGVDPGHWANPDPGAVLRWRRRLGEGVFLFVGRLVYYKGVDVLIEALRDSDLRVAICGEGPLRAKLEKAAAPLGDRVHFLGDVEPSGMPALYAACCGFVLPSVAPSETFGVVQLEAMAAGLPLVVSRASAGVESVHAGAASALLVEPARPEALREAMRRVRDENGLASRLSAAGHALIRERYDLEDRLDDLAELLVEAATGRSTAA